MDLSNSFTLSFTSRSVGTIRKEVRKEDREEIYINEGREGCTYDVEERSQRGAEGVCLV